MDKPSDSSQAAGDGGSQTKNNNNLGDTKSRGDSTTIGSTKGSHHSSNNNIDLGCGSHMTAPKMVNGVPAVRTKTTIPLPLGAPLPNSIIAASSPTASAAAAAAAAASTSATSSTSSTRFVTCNATTTTGAGTGGTINLSINTTTGGNFDVTVDPTISVENLKKIIAKKLKVAKDRIRLLHRERELQDGSLKDNNLMDGSKIILIPNVETGLLAQRPENTVMQALESLNDSQVNDFLSGKTPLNLSMRLGDHMMLIQLQLSTVNPANGVTAGHNGNAGSCSSSRTRLSTQRTTRSGSISGSSTLSNHHTHHHHHHHHHHRSGAQQSVVAGGAVTSAATAMATPAAALRKSNGDSIAGGDIASRVSTNTSSSSLIRNSDLSSFLSKRDYESLQNIVKSIAMSQPARFASAINSTGMTTQTLSTTPPMANSQTLRTATVLPTKTSSNFQTAHNEPAMLEQSPIKSLSNLVSSSPIETTTAIKSIPTALVSNTSSSLATVPVTSSTTSIAVPNASSLLSCQDPIAAKLTSCLCTRLNASNGAAAIKNCVESACVSRQDVSMVNGVPTQRTALTTTSTPSKSVVPAANAPSTALLHKTANNPIMRSKHRHHHHHHHHHHHYHHHNGASGNASPSNSSVVARSKLPQAAQRCTPAASNTSTASNDSGFGSDDSMLAAGTATVGNNTATASNQTAVPMEESGIVTSDTRTLAEASRNLTQTLRKLSKEVFTNKIDLANSDDAPRKSSSGAVIESMKNHGKGIYSGTFSGTLNPALQDRYGRPKRDISTVIHILNDLLSATPQYSRGARISFESPANANAVSAAGANAAVIASSSRSKQFVAKHQSHSHSQSCVKCLKAQASFGNPSSGSGSGSNSSHGVNYSDCNGPFTTSNSGSNSSSKGALRASHYACCTNLPHNGGSSSSDANQIANDRSVCSCRYRNVGDGTTGEREREHTCQKCVSEMDNLRTKSKLDQLRLVMQQRKQKREARKLKGAPYGTRVLSGTTTTIATVGSSDITETATSATTVAAAAAVASAVDASTAKSLSNSNNNSSSSGSSANSATLTTAPPSEVSPNHIVEEVDTAA